MRNGGTFASSWSLAILVAVFAVAVGCSSVTAPGIELALSFVDDPALGRSGVFEIGQRTYRFDAPEHRTVDAPGRGTVPVSVSVTDHLGGELVRGGFDMVFRAGHTHWIQVRIEPIRPLGHCVGSIVPLGTVEGTAAGTQARDTVFLVHGNIPEDAIC